MSLSTVTATIQDPSGQAFANGTWQLIFKPSYSSPGPSTDGGVAFTKLYGGSLDGTGSFSQPNVNRNDTIAPAGSLWTLIVSPNANGQAYAVDLNINNGAFNATAAINAAIINITVAATITAHAYKDSEVLIPPSSGATYYDVVNKVLKLWDSATQTWISSLTSSSGVVLNPAGNQLINQPAGTNLSVNRFENIRFADQFAGSDMVAQILAAMADMSTTGGDIYVPAGTYVCTTQLLIPNDGANPMPQQKSFRIIGAGMGTNSAAGSVSLGPNGGTILDLQFNATTGKIDMRGAGYLEITGITFKDSASDGTPFIFCTNTVLHLHDCAFFGSAAGTSAVNTGIILGGSTHLFNGTATGAFQGYGTVIRENQFHQLKTCILLQTDANNVQIIHNNIWADCGDSAGGAITLAPPTSTCVGNWIAGNLIEVVNYKYGIWLKVNSFNNTLIGNGMWDATATTTASVRCDSGATNNFILEGFASDTKPGLQDGNTVRANTILSAHTRTTGAGLGSFLNEPLTIVDSSAGPGLQLSTAGPGIPEYSLIRTDNNDQIYQRLQNLTVHDWGLWWKPLGGTDENLFVIEYVGVQQYTIAIPGTVFNSLDAPNGDLRIRSKSGNTLFLGDSTNTGIQVTNGNVTVQAGKTITVSADSLLKRIKANQATSLAIGDFAASGGFGTTVAFTIALGHDQGGGITITPGGAGIAANPTVTLTFKDGTWGTAPTVVVSRGDLQAPTTAYWAVTSVSATQVVFTFVGLPVSGTNYILQFVTMGN